MNKKYVNVHIFCLVLIVNSLFHQRRAHDHQGNNNPIFISHFSPFIYGTYWTFWCLQPAERETWGYLLCNKLDELQQLVEKNG